MTNGIIESIRRPPPLIPRLNKEKEIEFSIKPSATESFFYNFEKDNDTPETETQQNIQQSNISNKSIVSKIEDIRRIIFLLVTEPRSGIIPLFQYVVLISLIVLANLIMIMQTSPRWQFTPTTCEFCNTSNDNTYSEIEVNATSIDVDINEIDCVCQPVPNRILGILEAWCTYYFTVEWTLRVLCYVPTPSQMSCKMDKHNTNNYILTYFKLWCSYLVRPSTIIDALSIFSFYLVNDIPQAQGLKAMRMLRVLRLFQLVRIGKYSTIFMSLGNVFHKAITCLNMLMIVLLFGAIFFGSMIYYFEKGVWQYTTDTDPPSYQFMRISVDGVNYEISPYKSITGSFWWFIVTATTVGYGDYYPTSLGGKIVAVFAMISGVLVIAFPVSIFSDLWSKELKEKGLLGYSNDDDNDDEVYNVSSSEVKLEKELNDNNINNAMFRIIHGDNKNNNHDDVDDDEVLHDLMQQLNNNSNKDSNNSGHINNDIALNVSDINSIYNHYAIIQNSQNEIRNIMIRNLKQHHRESSNESKDEDEK